MNNNVVMIKREFLHPHPDNPRKDLGDLSELRESIKEHGVMQNLTVTHERNFVGPDLKDDYDWRPVKLRPLTEEEKKEYSEKFSEFEMPDGVFDCVMPKDGQQVLISTKWSDEIDLDVCTRDPDYGIGLEERGDWDGVLAWMPVPRKYKQEGEK